MLYVTSPGLICLITGSFYLLTTSPILQALTHQTLGATNLFTFKFPPISDIIQLFISL